MVDCVVGVGCGSVCGGVVVEWPCLGVTGGVVCVAAVIGGGLGGSELLLACC